MEGITHGIRPGSPRKVKIQVPKAKEEEKTYDNKTLRIQAKYGIGAAAKKKDEKKSKCDLEGEIRHFRLMGNIRGIGNLHDTSQLMLFK